MSYQPYPQPQPQPPANDSDWVKTCLLVVGALLALSIAFVCGLGLVGGYIYYATGPGPATPIVIEVPTRVTPPTSGGGSETPVFAPTVTLIGGGGGGETAQVRAGRFTTPPTIDGQLSEWGAIPSTSAPHRVYAVANWNGTADLNATWQLGWDEQNLYIGVKIVDDTHVQTQTGVNTFKGDSLEMQLDTNRDGDRSVTKVNEDDFQLAFSPGNFSQLTPEAFRFRGTAANRMDANPGHNIRVAAVKTSDGYTLEAVIPWADLGVTARAGLVMGLNLNANDNDSPGTAVQEVMMSNVSTRTFSNPTTWGMVTLE